MGVQKFSIESLQKIDNGRISTAFEIALNRCLADCKDRPALKEGRSVALIASIVPIPGDDGFLDTCDVSFQIVDKQPKRSSRAYNMKSTEKGLFFNDLEPDNIRQGTLDDAQGGAEEKTDGKTQRGLKKVK